MADGDEYMKADLHIHTNSSDGLFNAAEILEKARKGNLAVISITDHDNANAYRQFSQDMHRQDLLRDDSGVYIIPGIEISCNHSGEEIHVLGYFIDPESAALADLEVWMRQSRERRLYGMLDKLSAHNMHIEQGEILKHSNGAPIGRPHIAAAMCEKGFCTSVREAFEKFLEKGKPIYCEREKPSIDLAMKIIHAAGGLAFLAHPGLIDDKKIFAEVLNLPFDGIEVWHNSHDQRTSDYLFSFCMNNNKLKSGGSDYHGFEKDARLGDFSIDAENAVNIWNAAQKQSGGKLIFYKFVDTSH